MRLDLEVPGFTGFYDGIWGQSENEWNAAHEMKYGEHEDFESLNFIDDWGFGPDYEDKVAQLFAKEYAEIVKSNLGVEMEFVESYVQSPREYNFTTDRIFAVFDLPDYGVLVKRLMELADLPEYRTKLAALIKKYHSSYDGFMSFMSDDIEEWFGLMQDPSNDNYISCFIGYLLSLMAPEEIYGLNEGIYCYVEEDTDYHHVQPETEDAKEEWEIYLKYGTLYTDWASEHPIRHPDPYRPGYNTTDDWEDYKEAFMEVAEEYEQEQKRKAADAAWPVIPGLFDQ